LKRAAALGNPEASYALGTWYLFGEEDVLRKNKRLARWHIGNAAGALLPDALFDYGAMLEKGDGGPRDLAGAYKSYLRAAIRGDANAVFEVGRCLFYGIGCRQNRRVSSIWFARAAELGVSEEGAAS
jgi:TPR repeat protein